MFSPAPCLTRGFLNALTLTELSLFINASQFLLMKGRREEGHVRALGTPYTREHITDNRLNARALRIWLFLLVRPGSERQTDRER